MNPAAMPACVFGPFELDPSEHRLVCDGKPVPLTPKIFALLCVLVRHHGRLVSKDQLLEEVWPGTFVDEANLNRCVSVLRKALGERPGEPRFIETVPKVGYRFIAPVTSRTERASVTEAATVIAPAPPAPRLAFSRRSVMTLATLVSIGAFLYVAARDGSDSVASTRPVPPSHRQITFTGQDGLPTISPAGTRLAYVSSTVATKRVMIRAVDGGEPSPGPALDFSGGPPAGTRCSSGGEPGTGKAFT